MKKIVRLTESDLVRIVKRVIKENQGDIPQQIMDCASEVLTLSDLTKIPTCVELATQVMTTKKIPTDIMKGMSCATELASLKKTPQDATKFLTCVLTKLSSQTPVQNVVSTNENSRRSRRW